MQHQPPAKAPSPEHQHFPPRSSKNVVFKSHSSSVCPPGNPSPRHRFPYRVFQFLRRGLFTPTGTDMSGNSSSSACPSSDTSHPLGRGALPPSWVHFKAPFVGVPPARRHFAVFPTIRREGKNKTQNVWFFQRSLPHKSLAAFLSAQA